MTRINLPVQRISALMTNSYFRGSSRPASAGLDDELLHQGFFPSNEPRVPHISLVFREMWDSTNFNS
jgi:hypothetical protein